MEEDFCQVVYRHLPEGGAGGLLVRQGVHDSAPLWLCHLENIQKLVDAELKRTNHVNVAMPVLIPENLLKKEGELVEGFAPEAAWVTMGGSEKLEERMALRPTSETMFCDHWSHVLHSYRELPMLYNQWCSVVRWEKTTRPFLRTREFWWQEGQHHPRDGGGGHRRDGDDPQHLCRPLPRQAGHAVVRGRKTDKEKFAGAEATYTIESMMKDRKALQAGTSHYFGDKFSRAYDVTFTGRDNTLQYPFQTSWAVTTRLVGAIIMTHGDNHGLVLPPAIAPIQVAVIPVAQHKPGVLDAAAAIRDRLTAAGLRVKMDDSDQSPGWKFAQYEMKGVPCAWRSARATWRRSSAASHAATPARRRSCRWPTSRAPCRRRCRPCAITCMILQRRTSRTTPST